MSAEDEERPVKALHYVGCFHAASSLHTSGCAGEHLSSCEPPQVNDAEGCCLTPSSLGGSDEEVKINPVIFSSISRVMKLGQHINNKQQ